MDTRLILSYLKSLSENNNREWYHAHKTEYKEANAQFEALVGELVLRIGKFDRSILPGEAKELTFKLVRDTRFSHDKSPYHPAFRAHIGPGGKLPVPVGYYLMIKPGGAVLPWRRAVRGFVQRCHYHGPGSYRGKWRRMGEYPS